MASPTIAEVHTMLKNAVDLLEEERLWGESNAKNFVALQDTIEQAIESDFAVEILEGVASKRALLDASIRSSERVLTPILRTYGKVIAAPETEIQALLTKIYEYFADNAISVKTRAFTFGSPAAAGGNTGTGVILRLNKDDRNHDIEAQFPDAKKARCVADAFTGAARHEETFYFTGGAMGRGDAVNLVGSGRAANLRALSARDSLLLNPSFSSFTGTITDPTALTSWTVVGGGSPFTNLDLDQTNFYRDFVGDTAPTAVKLLGNETLRQKQTTFQRAFSPFVPVLFQVAFNREVGAADGTLTIRMGAVTASVALVAQTGWNLLRIAIGQDLWYRQFNETDIDIEIQWSARTTGTLLIDDALLVPGTQFDGSWYWILGGITPFLRDDEFTWTDTATDSKIQRWLWRSYGRYLPHSATPTVTDP